MAGGLGRGESLERCAHRRWPFLDDFRCQPCRGRLLAHQAAGGLLPSESCSRRQERPAVRSRLGATDLESWMGTFHATCAQILRREATRLGYKSNFAIYDESDQMMLVKHCMKKISLPERDFNPRAFFTATLPMLRNSRRIISKPPDLSRRS